MCSILGLFDLPEAASLEKTRAKALQQSALQRHRGPDWSGVFADAHTVLVHERLAIVDPAGGAQPIRSADGRFALAVNGEIYNHQALEKQLKQPYAFQTGSDCEVINALLAQEGVEGIAKLNGMFAFCWWDSHEKRYVIARDPLGVCPLYYGRDAQGVLWVASEMKALQGVCDDIAVFPPGHYLDSRIGELQAFWKPTWREYANTKGQAFSHLALRKQFEHAVHRQMMTDVPYGVLLSGGLDSSLVAACAMRFSQKRVEENDATAAWWPRLHSFAIGLEGSPDLAAARIAADAIGTQHHGFTYTIQEGLDALSDVVKHIETYDVTTIRASTPMFLLARRIKAMGVKMVLSGEGADEIFGGYLYFHKAPNAEEFHAETVRKIESLHLFDCARANKAMAAWGVEARVPFLDLEFIDFAMRIDAAHKLIAPGGIEKRILREAFAGYLPDEILFRQKEQFSDGVGYGWIDALKALAEESISDAELKEAATGYAINPPQSKEALMYRRLFEQHFPGDACAATVPGGKSIACSSAAAIAWDASFANRADPSGRAVLGVHLKAV